jgi:Ankyrin repeats (many copies)
MKLLYCLICCILLGASVVLEAATSVSFKKFTDDLIHEDESVLKSKEEDLIAEDMSESIFGSAREEYLQELIASENKIAERIKEVNQRPEGFSWLRKLQGISLATIGVGIAYAAKKAWDVWASRKQQESDFNTGESPRGPSSGHRGHKGPRDVKSPPYDVFIDKSDPAMIIPKNEVELAGVPKGAVVTPSMPVTGIPGKLDSELSGPVVEASTVAAKQESNFNREESPGGSSSDSLSDTGEYEESRGVESLDVFVDEPAPAMITPQSNAGLAGEVLIPSMPVSETPVLDSELINAVVEKSAGFNERAAVSAEGESSSRISVRAREEKTSEQAGLCIGYKLHPAVARRVRGLFDVRLGGGLGIALSMNSELWNLPDEQLIEIISKALAEGDSINMILNDDKNRGRVSGEEGKQNLLAFAIENKKSIELIKFLLDKKIRPQSLSGYLRNDNTKRKEIVFLLLSWGWPLEYFFRNGSSNYERERDLNELFELESDSLLRAIILGQNDVLRGLLERASPDDINRQDIFGMTLLHWAMARANVDAMIQLLEKGAHRLIHDKYGLTPIEVALRNGNNMMQYKADAEAEIASCNSTRCIALQRLHMGVFIQDSILLYKSWATGYEDIISVYSAMNVDMLRTLNKICRTNQPQSVSDGYASHLVEDKIMEYVFGEFVKYPQVDKKLMEIYKKWCTKLANSSSG